MLNNQRHNSLKKLYQTKYKIVHHISFLFIHMTILTSTGLLAKGFRK